MTSKNRTLTGVVIGSSVAARFDGWSHMLAQELRLRGWLILNAATSGYNTTKCKETFHEDIMRVTKGQRPDVVIIGLSLKNEGLIEDPQGAFESFLSGLQDLIKMATNDLGSKVLIGGVYPCNSYKAQHYELVQKAKKEMESWGYPVFDFLTSVDDGRGRWKKGTNFDSMHPNAKGHELMFRSIDISIFDAIRNEILNESSVANDNQSTQVEPPKAQLPTKVQNSWSDIVKTGINK